MSDGKPRIFVGSSSEGIEVARAIQENLSSDALCSVWDRGIFELTETTLDNLVRSLEHFQYAIFVFQPDDLTRIRDGTWRTVRDNVILEFGLFLGRLGKEHVFFLVPKGKEEVHLPSDLAGIQPGHYDVPENNRDLLAAVGPFCNQVRRRLSAGREANEEGVTTGVLKDQRAPLTCAPSEHVASEAKPSAASMTQIETGVARDEFGNTFISLTSTVFFSNRLTRAFPGVRGLQWFEDPREGVKRLELLLKYPLFFDEATTYGAMTDPIWWFRGYENMYIRRFEKLSDTRCLLDGAELEVSKVAAFRSRADYRSFVYVEVHADQPIGIYEHEATWVQEWIESKGYACEEYALYDGIPVSRMCYDDGAAVIDGQVTDIAGAELRLRYLSKYNFLIAAKFSPINSRAFDIPLRQKLDAMLWQDGDLNDICDIVEQLFKHEQDG